MKFTGLPAAQVPLNGDELIAITQNGVSKKVLASDVGVMGDAIFVKKSDIGKADGVPPLDAYKKIPAEFLPDMATGKKIAVLNKAARLSLPKHNDITIAYQSDDGSSWALNPNDDPSIESNWTPLGNTAVSGGVQTFNSRNGNVLPMTGDYNADMVAETAQRKYASPQEKERWDKKLDVATADMRYVQAANFTEEIQDTVAESLVAGENIRIVYNDTAGKITISSTSSGDVVSVNGKTGVVVLNHLDVGAAPLVHTHNTDDIQGLETLIQTTVETAISEELAGELQGRLVAGDGITITPVGETLVIAAEGGSGGGDVTSVNGMTGDVILDYANVGAAPLVHTHTPDQITGLTEAIESAAKESFIAGTNIAFTENEDGTVTISSTGGDVTLVGIQTLFNKTLESPVFTGKIQSYGAVESNISLMSSNTIDCTYGNYFVRTIATNTTFAFANAPVGVAYHCILKVIHGGGSISWPASVQWSGGVAPVLTTGKTHLFMFITDNGGGVWRGSFLEDYNA